MMIWIILIHLAQMNQAVIVSLLFPVGQHLEKIMMIMNQKLLITSGAIEQ